MKKNSKKYVNDDSLINDHDPKKFFSEIGLNYPEEHTKGFPLKMKNFPGIIEETLKKNPRKKKIFSTMRIRSNSLDSNLSNTEILINSQRFFHNLNQIHSKMKWQLLSILNFLFYNHQEFLSINIPNLISTLLNIITDLTNIEEIEILEGRLFRILTSLLSIETSLINSYFREIPRAESAIIKLKSPSSPKHSQFFKSFDPTQSSPLSQMKSGSGSPILKYLPRNTKIPKKFLRMITCIKYSMLPLIIFVKYRENAYGKPFSHIDRIRSFSGDSHGHFILTKGGDYRRKKSSFSNENYTDIYTKKSNLIKKIHILNEKPEISMSTFNENLIIYSKKQVEKWQNIRKMQEINSEVKHMKKLLMTIDQELMVCSICGKHISGRFLKEHSHLCKESDELNEKLKTQLNLLRNNDILWIDQMMRKSKNLIPIIKQQINKLNNTSISMKEPEISHPSFNNFLMKPPKPIQKILKTCPVMIHKPFSKNVLFNQANNGINTLILGGYNNNNIESNENENIVSVSEIHDTFKKFKLLKKKRELNDHIKIKELLEPAKSSLKILYKLNENLRNYRKLEITFNEESNHFHFLLQNYKINLDVKFIERGFQLHTKSQEIFSMFKDLFNIKRKIASFEHSESPVKRHNYSLQTSPLPFTSEGFRRWLRDPHDLKKRSNTSLEKAMIQEKIEDRNSEHNDFKNLLKNSFFSGQQLAFSEKKRKTLDEKQFNITWSLANPLAECESRPQSPLFDESRNSIDFDSNEFLIKESETLSITSDQSIIRRGTNKNKSNIDASCFSEGNQKKNHDDKEDDIRFLSLQQCEAELGQPINKVEDSVSITDFIFVKLIAKGAFGRVWLVKRNVTGEYYAMKIINFADKLTNNHLNMLKHENDIFKMIKGEMFVNAIFTFSYKNFICFVMEYMYGGDLGALLFNKGLFDESVAKYYIAEIIQAVDSLHKIGIVHRDLKPDNVLIDSQGHLKLTDFGLSDLGVLIQKELLIKHLEPIKGMNFHDKQEHSFTQLDKESEDSIILNRCATQFDINFEQEPPNNKNKIPLKTSKIKQKSTHIIGTPDYMSPEVINGKSLKDPVIDWWSVGVILFEFLTGIPPFNDDEKEKIFNNIRNHKIPWDEITIGYDENSVTPEAHDLINKLLDPDPKKRLGSKGVKDIQNHRFFRGVDWTNLRKKKPEYIPKIENIKDTTNFDKKREYEENEKDDPLFSLESNNSQKISEAENIIRSTHSFNLKRSDLLHDENQKMYSKFDEKKKNFQEEIEKKEFELRKLEDYCQEGDSLPCLDMLDPNIM